MGQNLKLLRYHPDCRKKRPLTAHKHVRLFGNGGGTPSAPTAPVEVQAALASPFDRLSNAAISPSAAL